MPSSRRVTYDCFRFCRRGFLGGEPPQARQGAPAGKAVSRRGQGGEPPQASRLAHICVVPFLLQGISRLTLETTSCSFDFIRLFAITTLLALEMASVYGYVYDVISTIANTTIVYFILLIAATTFAYSARTSLNSAYVSAFSLPRSFSVRREAAT